MGLLIKERQSIKDNYFCVWEIIKLLHANTLDRWREVGQFLGNTSIKNTVQLYQQDQFYRIHEIDIDLPWDPDPLDEIINDLMTIMPFNTDESIKNNIHAKSWKLYWRKEDIYNFKPLMELGIIENPLGAIPSDIKSDLKEQLEIDKYKYFLYKKPLLSIEDCACILSGCDPLEVERTSCNDVDVFFPEYSGAYRLIYSAIEANILDFSTSRINADDFKKFSLNNNFTIDGFNDSSSNQSINPTTDENTCNLSSLPKNELSENKELKIELAQAKERIKQLEEKEMQFQQEENATSEIEMTTKESDLLFIGALLKMLQSEIEAKGNKSQTSILQRIEDEHRDIKGLSKSRTEKLMGTANNLYKPLINKRMK